MSIARESQLWTRTNTHCNCWSMAQGYKHIILISYLGDSDRPPRLAWQDSLTRNNPLRMISRLSTVLSGGFAIQKGFKRLNSGASLTISITSGSWLEPLATAPSTIRTYSIEVAVHTFLYSESATVAEQSILNPNHPDHGPPQNTINSVNGPSPNRPV